MRKLKYIMPTLLRRSCYLLFILAMITHKSVAQDSTEVAVVAKSKPVKNTFNSVWLIDNQTVMVPIKGTLEMDIQHRFGTVEKGKKDVWGLFAPSNIRLGLNYSPVKNLFLGAGLTKDRIQVDFNGKYAIFQQTTNNSMPVSVTYFGNVVIDAREKENFRKSVHRFSYFNQLIIARKVTDKFSVQVAPSFSWFNNVEAYLNSKGEIQKKMNNAHFAVSVAGRMKLSEQTAIIAGYDQPLSEHFTNNPHPNICFGFEVTTSAHSFQVFAGNYYNILPQANNFLNKNDFRDGQFLIGFNITRLWNF